MPVQPDRPDLPINNPGNSGEVELSEGYDGTTITFPDAIEETFEPSSPDAIRLPNSQEISVDLGEIAHSLSYPTFEVNDAIAQDLTTVSSTLAETEKDQADQMVEQIQKQRQTVRVIKENLALNTDVVKAGIAQQKFFGTVIDYGAEQVRNRTKFTKYQNAGVDLAMAETHLSKSEEQLYQAQIGLAGTEELTPLIKQEWIQKKALRVSKIQDLQNQLFEASNLEQDMRGAIDADAIPISDGMGGGH